MLCISPANTDLQTSEALRFCRKFDEKGERTISVLTKLDLVQSADLKALVDTLNQLPLKLGYVGVKCRSKADLASGIDIPESLDIERNFFDTHPYFQRAGIKTGTPALADQLSGVRFVCSSSLILVRCYKDK
jgi:dynamin 1-like protein